MKWFFRRKREKSGKSLDTSGVKVIGVGGGGCNIVNHIAENKATIYDNTPNIG